MTYREAAPTERTSTPAAAEVSWMCTDDTGASCTVRDRYFFGARQKAAVVLGVAPERIAVVSVA